MKKYAFDAVIRRGRRGGAYVEFPFDVRQIFDTRGQVKVKALFDDFPYRGSLAPMGEGIHVLGLNREVREAIGKEVGDAVHVELERDLESRVVKAPDDLQDALDDDEEARSFFDDLSFTSRKEYVRWIEEAKKPEIRQRRLRKTMEKLSRGEKL